MAGKWICWRCKSYWRGSVFRHFLIMVHSECTVGCQAEVRTVRNIGLFPQGLEITSRLPLRFDRRQWRSSFQHPRLKYHPIFFTIYIYIYIYRYTYINIYHTPYDPSTSKVDRIINIAIYSSGILVNSAACWIILSVRPLVTATHVTATHLGSMGPFFVYFPTWKP